MNINFYFKHLEPTDALKQYVDNKLEHIKKVFHHIDAIDARFSILKKNHIFELTVHADASVFHIQKENPDMYAAIDQTIDALHIAGDKHHKKIARAQSRDIVHHLPKSFKEDIEPEISISIFEADDKPLTDAEAIMTLQNQKYIFLLYFGLDTRTYSVVFSRPDGKYSILCGDGDKNPYTEKIIVENPHDVFTILSSTAAEMNPMEVSEAAKMLYKNHLHFLAFINKETGLINILFESHDKDIILKRPIRKP